MYNISVIILSAITDKSFAYNILIVSPLSGSCISSVGERELLITHKVSADIFFEYLLTSMIMGEIYMGTNIENRVYSVRLLEKDPFLSYGKIVPRDFNKTIP